MEKQSGVMTKQVVGTKVVENPLAVHKVLNSLTRRAVRAALRPCPDRLITKFQQNDAEKDFLMNINSFSSKTKFALGVDR